MTLHKKFGNILFPAFTNLIWHLPRKSKTLYLTFDDGPYPKGTSQILNILREYNVPAGFFLSGEKIYQFRQEVQGLNYDDHKVGNHGFYHYPMFCRPTKNINREIQKTDELIELHFGKKESLFRPPFGVFGKKLEKVLNDLNKDMILWSLMSNDFKKDKMAVLNHLQKNVGSGDIIVFHDSEKSHQTTISVLPDFLNFCLEAGYKFSLI